MAHSPVVSEGGLLLFLLCLRHPTLRLVVLNSIFLLSSTPGTELEVTMDQENTVLLNDVSSSSVPPNVARKH